MKSRKVEFEIDSHKLRPLSISLTFGLISLALGFLALVVSFTPHLIPIIVIGAVCYYLRCWPFHRMADAEEISENR